MIYRQPLAQMSGRPRHTHRSGFTLLEVMLASVLAVVLMAALYVALDVQLRLADSGREAVEQATVTRSIVQRVGTDLSNCLGPISPIPSNSSMGMGTGTGTGTGTGMTTTDMGGTVVEQMTTTSTVIPFRAGVIGSAFASDESGRLTIYVGRVAGVGCNVDETGEVPNAADVRRITYWQTAHGLARQELKWVTSEAVQNSTEPVMEEGKEEKDYVIAEEVIRVQFYFWGPGATEWTSEWDGQTPGPDGVTPQGPPMAVQIRFWMMVPDSSPDAARDAKVEKEFRHTIAILGASGPGTSDADTAAANQTTMP